MHEGFFKVFDMLTFYRDMEEERKPLQSSKAFGGVDDWCEAIMNADLPHRSKEGTLERVYMSGHGDYETMDVNFGGDTVSMGRMMSEAWADHYYKNGKRIIIEEIYLTADQMLRHRDFSDTWGFGGAPAEDFGWQVRMIWIHC